MSHHSQPFHRPLRGVLRELEARSRLHPPKIYAPALYFGALSAPTGVRLLVAGVAERALAGKVFSPSQRRLADLYHRDRRTISRWCRVAVDRGWLRVIRRGKKLTNLYRLTRWLWGRLTGRYKSRVPTELQDTLYRLGLRMGVEPERMLAAGVTRRL